MPGWHGKDMMVSDFTGLWNVWEFFGMFGRSLRVLLGLGFSVSVKGEFVFSSLLTSSCSVR